MSFASSTLSCLIPLEFQLCTASEQEANVIITLEVPAISDYIKVLGRVMIAQAKNLKLII